MLSLEFSTSEIIFLIHQYMYTHILTCFSMNLTSEIPLVLLKLKRRKVHMSKHITKIEIEKWVHIYTVKYPCKCK